MTAAKVLLLGNGFNRAHGQASWEALLQDLARHVGYPGPLGEIPFPLLYELLFTSGMHNGQIKNELDLKKKIAERMGNIRPGELHEHLAAVLSPDVDILTPNYDFAIEEALREQPAPQPLVKERKYSLYRRYQAGGRTIWHMHGDCRNPASIMLGHDHYSGYLAGIETYLRTELQHRGVTVRRLRDHVEQGDMEARSWIDHLFLAEVHIVGFGCGFEEFHLWTLLGRKRRYQLSGFRQLGTGSAHYWCEEGLACNLAAMLDSYGVKIHRVGQRPTGADSWLDFYRTILDGVANTPVL